MLWDIGICAKELVEKRLPWQRNKAKNVAKYGKL